jgi:hypothetical protein
MHAWSYSIDRRPPAGHARYPPRPSPRSLQPGPPPRLLRVNMAIYIDIRWPIASPHACLVLFHRPSTTRRPRAVSTLAATQPPSTRTIVKLLGVDMAIYIDIRCCITSPHACLVLFHRPSTTRRPHAVSTWAFPRPRHPGPPPRLLCKDSVAYINIRLSITSLHARFVLLHRPSTALRPHPLPRSRQPGPSPRPLRVSMARYIDIRWSITSPRAGVVLL